MDQSEKLLNLLNHDSYRMKLLGVVASLDLPDCYIAAGFVRNMVWDFLHGYKPTRFNDVDVIYFDASERDQKESGEIENRLYNLTPGVIWQVKNQAKMHLRNHHRPYKNTADAMTYWPEKETAVGVRLLGDNSIKIIAPFGLDTLFDGQISYNPKSDRSEFLNRMKSKSWQKKWPNLKVVTVYPT